jgi:hypothetical protein
MAPHDLSLGECTKDAEKDEEQETEAEKKIHLFFSQETDFIAFVLS